MLPKKSKRKSINKLISRPGMISDYIVALVVVVLTLFGVVMVYNTSVVVAYEVFGDSYWFLKNQTLWALIGFVFAYLASRIDYHIWRKYASMMLLVTAIMLVLVMVPGFSSEVYGAHQRLVIPGGLPFLNYLFIQPSELMKLVLVFYLAALFSGEKSTKIKQIPHVQFFIIIAIVAILTAIEPDLGNAILIVATGFILYFVAGANLFGVTGVVLLGAFASLAYALSSEYRRQRLLTFLDPTHDPQGVSYQITQILIALGSGGIFGLGLGNSRQKYQYIPEVSTDSIFAIIGEELGLLGAVFVVAALGYIFWRGMKIAGSASDDFGRLVAVGITVNIGVQALVNLGGMVGVLPLTGVPLPFISYGGSSLTLLLLSVGVLINISRSAKVR